MLSSRPPTAEPTTGTPQAMASSGTMPNGSYQGTHATTSAERNSAGTSGRATAPRNSTWSSTPSARARPRRRRTSGSEPRASAGGPPATTSSVPGSADSAEITSSMPLRGTSRLTTTTRWPPRLGGATGPAGRKAVGSMPHGTTVMRSGSPPRAVSSATSSVHVATRWSASRRSCASTSHRAAGLVSAPPWCRRFTTPRAWNVCTIGGGAGSAPRACRPAQPDIQKWVCTTSGGRAAHRRRSARAKAGMWFQSSSLGTAVVGPATMCSTWTPGAMCTRGGRSGASARVDTVTSHPRPARCAASAATWTFCPPASAWPMAASGLACSETSSTRRILTGPPPGGDARERARRAR
jgi:hypothetical protein